MNSKIRKVQSCCHICFILDPIFSGVYWGRHWHESASIFSLLSKRKVKCNTARADFVLAIFVLSFKIQIPAVLYGICVILLPCSSGCCLVTLSISSLNQSPTCILYDLCVLNFQVLLAALTLPVEGTS